MDDVLVMHLMRVNGPLWIADGMILELPSSVRTGHGGTALQWRRHIMLWTIAVVLLVLWFLGLLSSYTMGGFIHLLLVLAIIAILVRIIQGRRPI